MSKRSRPKPLGPEKTGRRPSDRPDPQTHLRLTARDADLLVDLYQSGAMLRGQIQALYFGSVQRANTRLRALYDAGFVTRLRFPISPGVTLPHSCPLVYGLGSSGIPLVGARLGADNAAIRSRLRNGTPTYLAHALETVAFRLALREALNDHPEWHLEEFLPEMRARHAYETRVQGGNAPWRTEVFRPDALAVLASKTHRRAYAVEIDLGHTSSAEFRVKLAIHARYRQTGLFAGRYGLATFATLVVTTGERRLRNLLALAQAAEGATVLLTTFERLAEGAAAPIWDAPFLNARQALV